MIINVCSIIEAGQSAIIWMNKKDGALDVLSPCAQKRFGQVRSTVVRVSVEGFDAQIIARWSLWNVSVED